jgi:hypothetical protein
MTTKFEENRNEFIKLDLDAPATIEDVLKAVVLISEHDESDVQRLASEGRLRELFPFRARVAQVPPDFEPRHALKRASPLPLTKLARRDLIQASMPSKDTSEHKNEILSLSDLVHNTSSD